MKNLILIKQHSSIQLGHLYEHLFLMQLNEMLSNNGLFKWLDFSVTGTTYEQGGFIVIDFKAYNKKAIEIMKLIPSLEVDLSEPLILLALSQISAEEAYNLHISDSAEMIADLKKLNNEQWQAINDVIAYDSKAIKRRSKPIYLTGTKSKKPLTVSITLEINPELAKHDRSTLATFAILGRFILLSSSYLAASHSGAYQSVMHSRESGRKITVNLLFSRLGTPPNHQQLAEDILATYHGMQTSGAFTRLSQEAKNLSYLNRSYDAPDFEQTLLDTGILVGEQGWSQYLTESVILKVLNMTKLVLADKGTGPKVTIDLV